MPASSSHDLGIRPHLARALRVLERGLAAAGILCLTVYAGACADTRITQQRERVSFEERVAAAVLSEAPAPDQSEWSPQRVEHYRETRATPVELDAIGRLEIPDASVSVMVLDGTDEWTLNRAVGRIEGTAEPGEPGNMGIAGHRDGFFRGLRNIELGDPLHFATLEGIARYDVVDVKIVDPEDVEVLAPTADPSITLVTCYPFYFVGDAPKRFIVRALQVEFEPWRAAPVDASFVPGASR